MRMWLWQHLPSGAAWRYSRFAAMRRLGDWWLPRYTSIFYRVEAKTIPIQSLRRVEDVCHAYGWPFDGWCGETLVDGECPLHGRKP